MGTVNYLAPEMLSESVSTMESDLWALGCIIFKMITGRVPFPGIDLWRVRPLILNREINWPSEPINPVCRDLIEKLIQLRPEDRLGACGTEHDMFALMQHPFFEGIDFTSDLK